MWTDREAVDFNCSGLALKARCSINELSHSQNPFEIHFESNLSPTKRSQNQVAHTSFLYRQFLSFGLKFTARLFDYNYSPSFKPHPQSEYARLHYNFWREKPCVKCKVKWTLIGKQMTPKTKLKSKDIPDLWENCSEIYLPTQV